ENPRYPVQCPTYAPAPAAHPHPFYTVPFSFSSPLDQAVAYQTILRPAVLAKQYYNAPPPFHKYPFPNASGRPPAPTKTSLKCPHQSSPHFFPPLPKHRSAETPPPPLGVAYASPPATASIPHAVAK